MTASTVSSATSPFTTKSTPLSSCTDRPLSLGLPPSASSGLANRRRNNKNLSLCLTNSARMFAPASPKSAAFARTPTFDNIMSQHPTANNPYLQGPVCIMPKLYLGAEHNACDLIQLRQLSIQCILNVAAEVHHPHEHLFEPLEDFLIAPTPSLSMTSTASSHASSLQSTAANVADPHSKLSWSYNSRKSDDSAPLSSLPSSKRGSADTLFAAHIGYKKLPWDHQEENLAHELKYAVDAVRRAMDAGYTILVHCQCGVARSATVIIAFVMTTMGLPMSEAYDYVKARAPAISPNLHLLYQLREYEQYLTLQKLTSSLPAPAPAPAVPCSLDNNVDHRSPPSSFISSCGDQMKPIHVNEPTPYQSESPLSPIHSKLLFRSSSAGLASTWKRRVAKATRVFGHKATASNTKPTIHGEEWWALKK